MDLGVPSQVDGPLRDPPLILGMAEVNETLVPALPQGKDHGDGQTYPRPGQAEEGDDGVMSADEKMAFFEAIPELKPEVKPRSDGMERNDSDPLVNAKKKHGVFKEKHKVEGNLRQNEEESNKLAERQRNRKKRQRNCEERQRILMKRQRKLEKLTEVSIDIIYFLIAHRTDKRQKEHEKDMHMVSDINFKTNLLWKLFLALLLPIIAALSFKAMQLLQGILNKFFGN